MVCGLWFVVSGLWFVICDPLCRKVYDRTHFPFFLIFSKNKYKKYQSYCCAARGICGVRVEIEQKKAMEIDLVFSDSQISGHSSILSYTRRIGIQDSL